MLGFYNYTVILTYLSVVSAMLGISFSVNGNFKGAIICLLLSGLCDMTDGAVASTKKRTDMERAFGVQIDSLCDCISFGVLPPFIVYYYVQYLVPDNNVLRYIALGVGIAFTLAAIIRLAFFNVSEEERQRVEGTKKRESYRGLPVTNISLILPIVYLAKYFAEGTLFAVILIAVLFITGFLFLLDFKMKKLHGKKLIPVAVIGFAVFFVILFV
ncbi:MAG: CDP-alcohol phosphatidyltransferase family protein [Lachnospiraceae bacterium]|nr:CDP-alcohol phosphatidyltransferase family protein [Lachnospiraceae bacterium]